MTMFLTTGIIFGQTAFKIFNEIAYFERVNKIPIINLDEIHVKLDPTDFNNIKDGYFNHLFKIKKISNCKLKVTSKSFDVVYFLYKDMPGTIIKYSRVKLIINSVHRKIKLENILNVQINMLLEPLLNLRKCDSINEALMNWSLNNKFMGPMGPKGEPFKVQIDQSAKGAWDTGSKDLNQKKLIELNMIDFDHKYFKEKLKWFLECENINLFVPKKFIKKIQCIHKSKKNILILFDEFMDVIVHIHNYFIKMVRKYHEKEHVSQITTYNLSFPIELYGNKADILCDSSRKSLYMVRKSNDYLHFKSFAILFNLRWFFNTRYNCKKSLGFDGEYGRTINGYGQTFHKYDDVLLWLITHPNTIEDVEFVILDPIPSNYIF